MHTVVRSISNGGLVERETRGNGLRCQPGDLAIVTKCGVEERIGLLVRVLERCLDGSHDWLTELQGPGIVARGMKTGTVSRRRGALMYDWNLTPITGMDLQRRTVRCLGDEHLSQAIEAFPLAR